MLAQSTQELRRRVRDRTATLADFQSTSLCVNGLELDLVYEAESLFRDGLIDEAHRRLNLWTAPKWGLSADCQEAYVRHMAAQHAAQSPGATS
ncbi:hypothetical protein ACO2RV_04720 [Ancylobacter sp. VNQ12]|uniref:hypothetical protein n=1 Tax=Ancylobacter sp. VNQ12 TaxID=3400920 RepID=UPI003C11DA9E